MYETRPRTAGRAQAHGTSAVLEIFWLSDHPTQAPRPPAPQRTVNGTWALASRGVRTTPWPQFNPGPGSMTRLDSTKRKMIRSFRCEARSTWPAVQKILLIEGRHPSSHAMASSKTGSWFSWRVVDVQVGLPVWLKTESSSRRGCLCGLLATSLGFYATIWSANLGTSVTADRSVGLASPSQYQTRLQRRLAVRSRSPSLKVAV